MLNVMEMSAPHSYAVDHTSVRIKEVKTRMTFYWSLAWKPAFQSHTKDRFNCCPPLSKIRKCPFRYILTCQLMVQESKSAVGFVNAILIIGRSFASSCAQTFLWEQDCVWGRRSHTRGSRRKKEKTKRRCEEQADGQTVHCLLGIYIQWRINDWGLNKHNRLFFFGFKPKRPRGFWAATKQFST